MALITAGSFQDLSVVARREAAEENPSAALIDRFGVLSEASDELPAKAFDLAVSAERRGLTLDTLRLDKDFRGLLAKVFDKASKVYFLAWCWDLSGAPVQYYPGLGAGAGSTLIPMKGADAREFLGSGILLSPARPVTAGLALRMQLWLSNSDTRQFGQTMSDVAKTIQQSNLNSLLTLVATATGVTGATVSLVEHAALELATAIGTILKATSDDYVDYYEGYFPATDPWTPETQSWSALASTITLRRLS